jgi:hypothetical protein
MQLSRLPVLAALTTGFLISSAIAWDYEGHRMVNQLALAALPADFPAFVKTPTNLERIAFLAGEPDRWRNTSDHPVKHGASMEHYFDYEQIAMAGLDETKVPDFRYSFAAQFATGRAAHLAAFPPIDEKHNEDHTQEWPGFVPWAITENYGKLKSGFSYLKTLQELGTPEEIANAQANIIYIMGVMGHYVGDTSQPLHITIHHNGWVGPNPNQYTRWSGFHAWIDGGFIAKASIKTADILPQVKIAEAWKLAPAADGRDPMFVAVLDYVKAQHEFVVPLYELEKTGALKAENAATSVEGRKFIESRLLAGGQALASIWLTALKESGPDTYLRTQLEKRKAAAEAAKPADAP